MSWKLCNINPTGRKARKLSMLDVLIEAVVAPEIFISVRKIAGFAPVNLIPSCNSRRSFI